MTLTKGSIAHELRNLQGALRAVEVFLDPASHSDAHFIVADVARRLGVLVNALSNPHDHAVEIECCQSPPRP